MTKLKYIQITFENCSNTINNIKVFAHIGYEI